MAAPMLAMFDFIARSLRIASTFLLLSPSLLPAADYEFSWALPLPQGNALGGADWISAGDGCAVGARGTVMKTSDGGGSWSPVELFPEFVADLEDVLMSSPTHLIAVGAPPGIFRSTDGGGSWSAVVNPSTGRLTDIEVVTGSILSAIGESDQILRSTNQGVTWTLLTSPGADLQEQLWLDANHGYVVGAFRARRTTDGGQTWSPLSGVTDNDSFNEVFFTDPQHGFILSDFKLWRSTDGGATWTGGFTTPNVVYMGNAVVLGPEHFLVVSRLEGAAVFETTNAGATWSTPLNAGSGGFLDFDLLQDGAVVAVSDEGDVYRSTDGGETWTNATYTAFDPPRGVIGAIGVGPDGRGAAGTTGVPPTYWYRTTDGGATWLADPADPTIAFTREIAYWDADRGIAAGDYGRMWRTMDGGTTWTPALLPSPPANLRAFHIALPAPGVAFAACWVMSESMICRTTDYGATWEARSTGIPAAGGLLAISFLDANRGFTGGYAGAGTPRLFRTTNAGASWSSISATGLPSYPRDMHWHDEQVGLATNGLNPGGIYRTTNGGLQWHVVWPEPADELSFVDPVFGGATAFSFNAPGEILITEDGGVTWNPLVLPAVRGGTSVTALPDGFLVGGGSSVILRVTRSGAAALGEGEHASGAGLTLSTFPAIGSELDISFRLRAPGPARLAVYDPAGRHVAVLADGYFPGGIDVSRSWEGLTRGRGMAANGVYFVRLSTPDGARAAKVILCK